LFSNQAYALNLGIKKDRMLLRRSRLELETQLGYLRNCLPIGTQKTERCQKLDFEYKSLQNQYEKYKNIHLKERCVFCSDKSLTSDEIIRHNDYHVAKRLLALRQENAYDDVLRYADIFVGQWKTNSFRKNAPTTSTVIKNSSQKAIDVVDRAIQKAERHVMNMFAQIKESEFTTKKVDAPKSHPRLLYDSNDNVTCPLCGDGFDVWIDRTQDDDFAYAENVIRYKNSVFCNVRCAGLVSSTMDISNDT
jgi:hypothetical protein